MTAITRRLAGVLLVLAAAGAAGCVEEGIGMTPGSTGARWSGGGTGGPDVFVGGGPVYR
jgi:hypothetical protein